MLGAVEVVVAKVIFTISLAVTPLIIAVTP